MVLRAHMHAGGAIRTVHVAAAAIVIVGALVAAARPAWARRYEWLFWSAALALVLTGVGNFSARGDAVGGTWGARFSWKLGLVAALLLLSAGRVLLVALDARARTLRAALAATAVLASGILSLGLVLAHG